MLVRPPLEQLLPKVDNRYTLAILVAKRARQLVNGGMPLIRTQSPNYVTIACEELGKDRIQCVKGIVSPYVPLRPEVEAARLAAKNAAAQASMADAVKEELERAGTTTAEQPSDESDVRLISEALVGDLDDEDQEQSSEDDLESEAEEASSSDELLDETLEGEDEISEDEYDAVPESEKFVENEENDTKDEPDESEEDPEDKH
jgi:DNA-directed RNA polymerase omega subunit